MSITDELREWSRDNLTQSADLHITAFADRIDAEHEAKVAYWQEASYRDGYDEGFASADDWLAQHEDAMAEHGWVRLPKDANGECIHLGDVMEWVSDDECYSPVIRTVEAVGDGTFFAWDGINGRYAQYEAHAYRHHHAPTVEDVLREMLDAWGELPSNTTNEAIVAEYAAKLQLREVDA